MSNYSNIGFNVYSEQQLRKLVENVFPKSYERSATNGIYFQYADPSGAELWILINHKREIIAVNPHFAGKSNRKVRLTASIEGSDSMLDGAYHCWACNSEQTDDDQGLYPFIFDVPDFNSKEVSFFPRTTNIQLSAFAREISYFEDEEFFMLKQEDEFKWAAKSFIPSGLFSINEVNNELDSTQSSVILSGEIAELEKKLNQQTGSEFYWILVDTLGGSIDVVADLRCFNETPSIGGIIHGRFWLSGRFVEKRVNKGKGIFGRLFG